MDPNTSAPTTSTTDTVVTTPVSSTPKSTNQTNKNLYYIIGGLVAAVIVVAIIVIILLMNNKSSDSSSSNNDTKSTATTTQTTTETSGTTKPSSTGTSKTTTATTSVTKTTTTSSGDVKTYDKSKTYVMGEAVPYNTTAKHIEITANSVENYTAKTEFGEPEEGKKLVAVSVTVKNVKKTVLDTAGAASIDFTILNKSGTEYDYYLSETKSPSLTSVDPTNIKVGESKTGYLVFEVDESDNLADLTLKYISSADDDASNAAKIALKK